VRQSDSAHGMALHTETAVMPSKEDVDGAIADFNRAIKLGVTTH